MNKKNYIDKIEHILNTSGYITRKEKDMILDYVDYFKSKNNVIEDKNIELVFEIERLNNIIKEVREYIMLNLITEWDIKNNGYVSGSDLPADAITPILKILDKEKE